jgi:hypothetical protein
MDGMWADRDLLGLVRIAKDTDPGEVNVPWQPTHLINIGGIFVSRAATAN